MCDSVVNSVVLERKPSDFKSHKMHQSMVRVLSLGTLDSRFSQPQTGCGDCMFNLLPAPRPFGFSSVILMFLDYD